MKKSEALKILGLTEGASDDEVKRAHRKLIVENHPDKFGQDPKARAQAEEKTKLINEARDVLLNRSWDPEYGTAGTPYGVPFNYNPYADADRPAQDSGQPYGGWPFAETFVWTSWDDAGHRTTHTASGTDPFAGASDPFEPFRATGTGRSTGFTSTGNPWADLFSAFFIREPTTEELLEEEKAALERDQKIIGAKVVLLAVSIALSASACGLYLYTIISIGQGIWKRLGVLSIVLLLPFVMLAIIFAPNGDSTIGIVALVLFVVAIGFDVRNISRHLKRIKELKNRVW